MGPIAFDPSAGEARRVEALEAFRDVTRVRARSGQRVFYSKHVPPGLFLVLEGRVAVLRGDREDLPPLVSQDAASGAFLFPSLEELTEPSAAGVLVEHEAEMLFIPRSLALLPGPVRRFLESEARFPTLALR